MTAYINKIKSKAGDQQLPVTHERAVRDDNGTTLESKLQNLEGAMDKAYVAQSDNGMGRITLKKNMVGGVNTLTQNMMQATNTIYVIRYDFTLGEDITVPANCVLEFDGGSVSGAYTLNGNKAKINSCKYQIFGNSLNISDFYGEEYFVEWFGASTEKQDNSSFIQKSFDSDRTIIFGKGTYNVTNPISVENCQRLKVIGEGVHGRNESKIKYTSSSYVNTVFIVSITGSDNVIKGITFEGPETYDNYKMVGGLKLYDMNSYPGNLDCYLYDCYFNHLGLCIEGRSRGLYIDNCNFTSSCACVLHKLHVQSDPAGANNEGRAIKIKNCRIHFIQFASGFIEADSTFLLHIKDVSDGLNLAYNGLEVSNNYSDGDLGSIIVADNKVNNILISNNICINFTGYAIVFRHSGTNIQIINNTFDRYSSGTIPNCVEVLFNGGSYTSFLFSNNYVNGFVNLIRSSWNEDVDNRLNFLRITDNYLGNTLTGFITNFEKAKIGTFIFNNNECFSSAIKLKDPNKGEIREKAGNCNFRSGNIYDVSTE